MIDHKTQQPSINLNCSQENNLTTICVNDNGPGIPDELIDTLFEPFVTKGKANGTGLGLAISQQIIEAHGGIIKVFNTNPGASFSLILPQLS